MAATSPSAVAASASAKPGATTAKVAFCCWAVLAAPPSILPRPPSHTGSAATASAADPTIAAYRDEILFRQTVDRYTSAWHHREPFWYFIVQVIPGLWLPLTLLLPWLVPQWRKGWQARDLRIALLVLPPTEPYQPTA